MAGKILRWFGLLWSGWCTAGFLYLTGWVIFLVVTGKGDRWILFCVPFYILLSWSFYLLFRSKLHKLRKPNGNTPG
jgi:hypothetical protein